MDDLLFQVEPMIPALRRYARGFVRDAVAAGRAMITEWLAGLG